MKSRYVLFLIFFTFIFFYISCSNDTVDPATSDEQVQAKIYQSSKCLDSGLNKITTEDSCFTYDFSDDLEIDLCVTGNCCPDSNRFTANYTISSDTIFVTVTDTAENLCNCLCNYQMHLEFTGLTNDEYVFNCNAPDINYKEIVQR